MYIILSWWKRPMPGQEPRDCTPQVEEVSSEDMAQEKARKKKRHLGSGSRVVITEIVKEVEIGEEK